MRLSQEPCLGVNVNSKRPVGRVSSQALVSLDTRYVCGMIVEDQPDRGAGRVGGVEKLEEFDELAAAVAVSDEAMDLSGEQIDPGQQAERAVALILIVARACRVRPRHSPHIRRC